MKIVKSTGLLAMLLAAFVAAIPVYAVEDTAPRTYVVVVGISQYADPQIKPRPHAEDDAKAFYDLCVNSDYLGAGQIRLLLGSTKTAGHVDAKNRKSEPATHANILKDLQWAASKARRDDLVLFAFIGQGGPLGDRACYFASDSTFKDRAKNGITAQEIEHELDKMKSQRFCAFLDVNFKPTVARAEASEDFNSGKFYLEFLGPRSESHDGEESPQARGRVLFLATDGLTPSLDLDKHGLFMKAILDGLKGAADSDGYEPDGIVTVDELIKYLNKEVPRLVRKNAKTSEEKKQHVFIFGGRSSHFDLTKNPKAAAKVQERLEKFNNLAKEEKLAPEIVEEGRKYLTRMPRLKAHQKLRKDYQKLVDGTLALDAFLKERQGVLSGMQLDRDDAESFARKVYRTTKILREDYVKVVNQGELIAYAIRGLYRQLSEEIPQDIRDQLGNAKTLKEDELIKLLADVRERLGKREDLENHKDVNFALQHMMSHLDPYTAYIDPESRTRFMTDTSGRFTGIGVQIKPDELRDMLRVVTPLKGSPAYKAGIKAGDLITTITREVDSEGKALDEPEVFTTKGMSINEAVKKILGKPGTKVKVTVEREGVEKPIEFDLARSEIEMDSVLSTKRNSDDSWDYFIDPEKRIGYIRITSFTRNTAEDLKQVVEKLDKEGLKGLVLDLRFNPGGLLQSANEVCDLFIDDGLIVTIRPRVGKEHSEFGSHEGSFLDFPMVCLVNHLSASGSEIVAACLQDHKRAIVMGERSYGKGSVQNIIDMENRTSALKLTTATYWRPSGKNIHRFPDSKETDEWGVSPDKGYVIKLPIKESRDLEEALHDQEIIPRRDLSAKETKPAFKDKQLDAALQYLRDQIKLASRVKTKKAG